MNTDKETRVGFPDFRRSRHYLHWDGDGSAHLLYPVWFSHRLVFGKIYHYNNDRGSPGYPEGSFVCAGYIGCHLTWDDSDLGTYHLNAFRPG